MKYVLILILSFLINGCEKPKEIGIEIYQAEILYPDFTKVPIPDCSYCFDIKKIDLYDEPIITEFDIENFDWEKQQITLTENGKKRISMLEIPLPGLPVVMVLNGELIYGFWFWNDVSSFGCDRVYAYPKFDFKIKFGLPSNNTFGDDPRYDERIKKYLEKKEN